MQSQWFLTDPHAHELQEGGTLIRESHNFHVEIKSLQRDGTTPCASSWGLTFSLTTELGYLLSSYLTDRPEASLFLITLGPRLQIGKIWKMGYVFPKKHTEVNYQYSYFKPYKEGFFTSFLIWSSFVYEVEIIPTAQTKKPRLKDVQ